LAVTLADFPGFLGKPVDDFLIVIGAKADPADVAGAADVAIALAVQSTEEVTVPGAEVAVEGKKGEIYLGTQTLTEVFGNELTASDVPALFRGVLEHNRTKYTVIEKIIVPEAFVMTDASTLNGTVYLDFSNQSATPVYQYVIDEGIGVGNFSETKPLSVKLFGREFLIKSAEDGKIVAFSGVSGKASPTVPVVYGDYKIYADQGVSEKWAHVIVMKGESKVGEEYIEVGDTETIGDLDIKLLDVVALPMEATVVRADMVVGPTGETEKAYLEGDDFPGTDLWYFSNIDVTGNLLKTIELTYKVTNETYNYLKPGEKLFVPNNYVDIGFQGFSVDKHVTIEVKTGTTSLYASATSTNPISYAKNKAALILEATDYIFNTGKSKVAYIVLPNSSSTYHLGYLDSTENKVVLADDDIDGKEISAKFGKTDITVLFDSSADMPLNLTIGGDSILANYTFDPDKNTVTLGKKGQAEEGDVSVTWDNDVNGEWEYDAVSPYGVIVKEVEKNAKYDKIVLQVPEEQQAAIVYVGKLGGAAAGATYVKYTPVTMPVARLDTELTPTDKKKNLVVVGGPCVNKEAYNALNITSVPFPACGADSTIPENAAIIKIVSNYPETGKYTVVVAGWEKENTRTACAVIQQYATLLKGQAVSAVKVTSATTAGITPL
jgi:hypothetical protein